MKFEPEQIDCNDDAIQPAHVKTPQPSLSLSTARPDFESTPFRSCVIGCSLPVVSLDCRSIASASAR